jgi:hypothetical protein
MGRPERPSVRALVVAALVVVVSVGAAEVADGDGDGEVSVGDGEVEAAAGEVEVLAAGADVAALAAAVAVTEAVAGALTADKDSQDSLVPVAVAAAALPAMTAATPPEVAVSRAPPAIKVAALRRPCVIRISHICQYQSERNHSPCNRLITSLDQVGTVRGTLDAKLHI